MNLGNPLEHGMKSRISNPITHSLEVVWDRQLRIPIRVIINQQSYAVRPADEEPDSPTGLHECITDEAVGALLSLGRSWAQASTEECERALVHLAQWRDYNLPAALMPEIVALLARLYLERAA